MTRPTTICNRGHLIDGSNKVWQADKRRIEGGRWACRTCKANAESRYYQAVKKPKRLYHSRGVGRLRGLAAEAIAFAEESERSALLVVWSERVARARMRNKKGAQLEAEVAQARTEILGAVAAMAKDDSKKPWRLLQIKPDALDAWDKFDMALQKARNTGEGLPNCENNPGPYMDYDEEDLPTARQAAMLCADCPLFDLCDAYVQVGRPTWGVQAGLRWEPIPGKPYDGQVVMD